MNKNDVFSCQKQLQPNNTLNTLHIVKLQVPVLYFLYLLQFSTHALVYARFTSIYTSLKFSFSIVEYVKANKLSKNEWKKKKVNFLGQDRSLAGREAKQRDVMTLLPLVLYICGLFRICWFNM